MNNLRDLLKNSKLTEIQIAETSGVSKSTIQKIKSGAVRSPREKTEKKLLDVVGMAFALPSRDKFILEVVDMKLMESRLKRILDETNELLKEIKEIQSKKSLPQSPGPENSG